MSWLADLHRALFADLQTVRGNLGPFSVFEPGTGETAGPWIGPPVIDMHDAAPGAVIVRVGHNESMALAGSPQELLAEVASRLQDEVIDALWRPWPELSVPSESAIVLEPAVYGATAVWASRHGFACPIGRLHECFGALVR